MTNEEAKALYKQAKATISERDYEKALELLEEIEQERPNSRKVAELHIFCYIQLGELESAELALEQLRERVGAQSVTDLDAMLSAAQAQQPMPQESMPVELQPSTFVVEAVYPLSVSQSTVMGFMESGSIHARDKLLIRGTEVSILRLGPAQRPISILHHGEHGVMLLGADSNLITAGAALTVAPTENKSLDTNGKNGESPPNQAELTDDQEKKPLFSEGSKLMTLLILLLILIIIIGMYDIWD